MLRGDLGTRGQREVCKKQSGVNGAVSVHPEFGLCEAGGYPGSPTASGSTYIETVAHSCPHVMSTWKHKSDRILLPLRLIRDEKNLIRDEQHFCNYRHFLNFFSSFFLTVTVHEV